MKHALAVGLLLAIGTVHAQAPLKSPEAVSTGLRIMSQVVRHTDRLIAAKTYEPIPHECGEFEEGMKGSTERRGNATLRAQDQALPAARQGARGLQRHERGRHVAQ